MNQALYQSFQQFYQQPSLDESDSFFDDAKSGLMKDLVDFQSRDDFDQYMRSIEKNYYQKANIPPPPYESLPDYPPKPYQTQKKKKQHEEQRRDFIDKVNEVNQKRQQTYQQQQYIQNQHYFEQQKYFQDISNIPINPYQNPFFDSVINKENLDKAIRNPAYAVHTPSIHGTNLTHFGGQKQPVPQHGYFNNMVEPPMMTHPQPSYMQKFVAGPTRLEANPLSEPMRNFKNGSPQKLTQLPQDLDLKNPDAQYERYKHLMQNQYYNINANSMRQGFNLTGAHTVYQPPAPFNYVQSPPANQPNNHDMYNVSFNQKLMNKNQVQQDHIFPNTQQIYHAAGSIQLYSDNRNLQQPVHPGYVAPHVYRTIKENNLVGKNIIDSLGGIEDTLKPLQETLKIHELRPFQIQRDYRKEYLQSSQGKHPKRSLSECRPENMKLVSVSPYRAVVKIDKDAKNQDGEEGVYATESSDDEYEEDDLNGRQTPLTEQPSRNSPIRLDSQSLRGQRENFLNSFNEKRSYTSNSFNDSRERKYQQPPKEHQKVRMESEYLRAQREQYLNGFTGGGPQLSTASFRPQPPNNQFK